MRRARGHGHVSQERWLVSYADFITLLFAFFVVMYAVTRSHQVKAAQVSEAVQQGFKSMSAPGQLAKMAANAKPAAPQPQVQTVTVTEASSAKRRGWESGMEVDLSVYLRLQYTDRSSNVKS